MKVHYIPHAIGGHREGTLPDEPKLEPGDKLLYEPQEGEFVHVLLWERYPDYDFIFGVPDEKSSRYEKEIAFFQFRRVGDKTHYGHYFDVLESLAMVAGFNAIIKASKDYSPHLWRSHHQKT